MLFLARRTALPTPGETCVCWAKIDDAQTNVANRNRERCFIAVISALVVCWGMEVNRVASQHTSGFARAHVFQLLPVPIFTDVMWSAFRAQHFGVRVARPPLCE